MLGFKVWAIDVRTQKIIGSISKKFGMRLTSLQTQDINTFSSKSLDGFVAYKKFAILGKYLDFADIFLEKSVAKLPD